MNKYFFCSGLLTVSLFGSMNIDQFETQFDKAYQAGQFQSVLEMRSQGKSIHSRLGQKFEFEMQKLEIERNKALLELCDPASNLEICQRIQRIASFQLTNIQAESLKYISSLKCKPLNSSHSPLENQLIAIDAEYECKGLYVDLLFSQGKISLVEKKGMKVFFKVEKMHKMIEIANNSNEHAIGRLIEEADKILGPYQAYLEDIAVLESLAKGTASPSNPLESQVKEIYLAYQAKSQQLISKYLTT